MIDKDRIAGSAKQVEGTVKEAVGKVIGDAKLVADGKSEKVEGKIQNTVGGIKDALKE
ncbi:CsbD family protein [Rhodopila globiformis]|uniref:CsbD family protein n=1 Tax=Rhodopila globiformis TaxID=1071 RepID=UPI0026BA39E5